MTQLIRYLKNFIKEDFNFGYYLSVLIFLTISIFFNYYYDFENSVLRKHFGEFIQIFYYLIFFAIPYFFSLLARAHFKKEYTFLKPIKNLTIIFLLLFVLSFNASSYSFFQIGTRIPIPLELSRFFYKCLVNITYSINFIIPLLFLRKIINRELENFYGLTTKNVDLKIFYPLLIVPIVLTGIASFNKDFLNIYPTYDAGNANSYWHTPPFITAIIYEILYGLQFVVIELFFRGFLVIGMVKYLGKSAILSMVCVYTFWHFGKPVGETIGSVFGGYILGVLSYYTRNIWGGIILHVGTAWSMEASAFFQKIILSL